MQHINRIDSTNVNADRQHKTRKKSTQRSVLQGNDAGSARLHRHAPVLIVGAASSPAKRDFALRNGADEVVDYADDFPPLDVTIDGIGEPIFGKCRAVTRQLGRIVGLGNAGGTDPDIPDYERQRRDNVITIAFSLRALRDEEPARFRALAEPALPLLSSGQIAVASAVSSNPTTLTSPGTSSPRRCATATAAAAISSLLAKIAVGGWGRSSSASLASSPER